MCDDNDIEEQDYNHWEDKLHTDIKVVLEEWGVGADYNPIDLATPYIVTMCGRPTALRFDTFESAKHYLEGYVAGIKELELDDVIAIEINNLNIQQRQLLDDFIKNNNFTTRNYY